MEQAGMARKYELNPNPATSITIQFEQGNQLIWNLSKPLSQVSLMEELGLIAARYELELDFSFPTLRETLEQEYDRPSFHCRLWSHRMLGAQSAIMDQHQNVVHRALVEQGSSFSWTDQICDLCGYDAARALRENFADWIALQPKTPPLDYRCAPGPLL